jgi:Ras-related protein Rab-5C
MASKQKSFKVVLLGEAGVGKTSIISQFIDESFQEEVQSSTGGTYNSKKFVIGNKQILEFEIWDTAGQERYRSLTTMYYKDANAAILVYDITVQKTFDEIKTYWANQVKETSSNDIILVVCGNKSDLVNDEQVDEEKAREFANEIGALFFLTSAKNSSSINDVFIQIAKKYSGNDNVRIKENNEEIQVEENQKKDNNNRQGSVKIDNNVNNKNEKKRKCC